MKLKKKKGSIARFGIPLFAMVAMFVGILMFLTYTHDTDKKDGADIIAREYLLRMETEGFLNATDEAELYNDLANCGVKNISLTGTTRSKIGYGKRITLRITGEVEVTNYKIDDLFKMENEPKLIPINITKSSTAKY